MAKSLSVDLTGCELTCGNEEALEWFNKAIFAYTTVRENALPMLYKAVDLDSSFILAHCVLVCLPASSYLYIRINFQIRCLATSQGRIKVNFNGTGSPTIVCPWVVGAVLAWPVLTRIFSSGSHTHIHTRTHIYVYMQGFITLADLKPPTHPKGSDCFRV